MKYIDADRLRAEIERAKDYAAKEIKTRHNLNEIEHFRGVLSAYYEVGAFLDSLQQEQPTKGYDEKYLNEKIAKAKKSWEGVDVDKYMDDVRGRKQQEQPEVDLEKEYKEWWETRVTGKVNIEHTMEWFMHETARHFYELGLNARKNE